MVMRVWMHELSGTLLTSNIAAIWSTGLSYGPLLQPLCSPEWRDNGVKM